MFELIIFISSAAALSLICYMILNGVINKTSYISRLNKYIDKKYINRSREAGMGIKAGLNLIGKNLTRVSLLKSYKNRIQRELIKAHILLKGEEFLTLSLASMIIFLLIGSIFFRNFVLGGIFGIIGWNFPMVILKQKKRKRIKVLNGQISDAIVLISNSLKAGYSFFQAIDMVARETSAPIKDEFIQLQKEINLGYTTEQALENMSSRVESEDLGLVIIAVLTQRQVGGNLAEILDNISGTIRDRIKIKGEIRTLTAQGRISGAIIAMVPVALAVVLQITNPEYIGLLFTSKVGWAILGVAVTMQLVGIYSINKIIKIEV